MSERNARISLALLALVLSAPVWAGGVWADEGAAANLDTDHLERLVIQDCGSCHGLTLKGGLGPDLRAQSLAGWDQEALAQVILDGIPGTAMPAWRPIMTKAEADWIARYLLTKE